MRIKKTVSSSHSVKSKVNFEEVEDLKEEKIFTCWQRRMSSADGCRNDCKAVRGSVKFKLVVLQIEVTDNNELSFIMP